MKVSSASFFSLFTLLARGVVEAAPPTSRELYTRASTCNTPSNRACWTTGFNINTDYEASTPSTGVTRTYSLSITEVDNWTGPDGVVKSKVMLINGKYPGPTISADWGDRITITVTNNLRTNGTSMHWHGIRQLGSNLHDGANGVTECPIPPKGGSKVYSFVATQYGTSWYHSHFSAQYGNGVVGTIQINGPASLPYDTDLGVFPVSDYYYSTADDLVVYTKSNGPPPSDNVLFNGTNVHPTTGAGKYANVTLTPGKRHRLRIINTSVENHFTVSLANHSLTVIAADLVPVNAYTASSLFLGPGQRYDVAIDASQVVSNYWFNATLSSSGLCGASNNPYPAAIFHYAGAPGGLPTNPGTTPSDTACTDTLDLVPVVSRTVPTSAFTAAANNTLPVHLDLAGTPLFVWEVNSSSINLDWSKPTVQYILDSNTSYPASLNTISIPSTSQWTYWLIANDPGAAFSLPHPFHLHGHDFLVIGRGSSGAFNAATDPASLRGANPTRRDVAMLPAGGWLAIAFRADNPGAWLMHCHIAWHVSGGLAVQFVEGADALRTGLSAGDKAGFNDNCGKWRAYFPSQDPFPKDDSGI